MDKGHVASLDGMRAVAVLAVMGTHFDVPLAPGGQLGVDVFFVLSGFLITGLIAAEQQRTGRMWWRGFFARRALRLFPALWIAGAFTVAMVLVTQSGITPQALAGIGKDPGIDVVANTWREVGIAFAYLADFPHLFDVDDLFFGHAWSLAVEEQFYLVMPLLWIGICRVARPERRWVGFLAISLSLAALRIAGVAGPLAVVALRIDGLFLGCALALALLDPRVGPGLERVAGATLVPAIAGLGALIVIVGPDLATTTGRVESWLATVCTGLIVVALWVGRGGLAATVLTLAPLAALGRISYGVYLFHLPIARRIALADLDAPGPAIVALKFGLSVGIAAASYVLVERRVLRRKDRYRPAPGPTPAVPPA